MFCFTSAYASVCYGTSTYQYLSWRWLMIEKTFLVNISGRTLLSSRHPLHDVTNYSRDLWAASSVPVLFFKNSLLYAFCKDFHLSHVLILLGSTFSKLEETEHQTSCTQISSLYICSSVVGMLVLFNCIMQLWGILGGCFSTTLLISSESTLSSAIFLGQIL